MTELSLSYGFDDERPYGPVAMTDSGRAFLKRKVEFIDRMNDVFDRAEIPRTHFLLGSYIEAARTSWPVELLQDLYPIDNPLLEVQQHSYSHGVMSPLPGVAKVPMGATAYVIDLERANNAIERTFDVRPTGLRTPYGYPRDLSDRPDVLEGMRAIGLKYVSSDLGEKDTLVGAMTAARQPHSYAHVGFPDIVEVPSHGAQDVVFTFEKQQQLGIAPAETPLEHYAGVLETAKRIGGARVSVALCLHPWAVMDYDPKLTALVELAERARDGGFALKTYGEVANDARS